MVTDRALIIFIKNPRLGQVKTRLARDVGEEKALECYFELLHHTRSLALQICNCERWLFYSDYLDTQDQWDNKYFKKALQKIGTLGERLKHAAAHVVKESQTHIIMGSDCPYITKVHVDLAFATLQNHDLVIGPATDGGYYLIGATNYYPSLFEDIRWSTEHTLSDTLRKADELNLKTFMLETLDDIDTIADWQKFVASQT